MAITSQTHFKSENIWNWCEITFVGEILTSTEFICTLPMLLRGPKEGEGNGSVM